MGVIGVSECAFCYSRNPPNSILIGDRIAYHLLRQTIDDQWTSHGYAQNRGHEDFNGNEKPAQIEIYGEHFASGSYQAMVDREPPPIIVSLSGEFMYSERCEFDETGFVCTVPTEHYFMMGDNRDHSRDFRYWGFLPADHIVGKVMTIFD
ncbi:signal peptidase I [Undibacterium sp. Ji22W]|uniref:signal peptidase I n=1 Tax=Undibacterium sp. Ji22W TaxID=3413038 RepID=UPI003BF42631